MPAPATVPMDPAVLSRRSSIITGETDPVRRREALAPMIGYSARTIERWESAGEVPTWLPAALDGLEWRVNRFNSIGDALRVGEIAREPSRSF